MTPNARVAAAIDVMDHWARGSETLERALARWGRANRYAGSGDRHAIADLSYDACRRWRSAAWAAGLPEGSRSALIGLTRLAGDDPRCVFTGERHAPASLEPAEDRPRAIAEAPLAVRLDLADWMPGRLSHVPEPALEAMRKRAPLDVRVNTLKTDLDGAIAALADDGIAVGPGPLSPTALRVTEGARRFKVSRAYERGMVEVMDAASQAVADYSAARPGETVIDWCAGAGGKTLALAAAMQNRGRLIARDADPARLSRLWPRAGRAGAKVEAAAGVAPTADLVLVDAPCSGSGTWRRTPDAKWRLKEHDLTRFADLQHSILLEASRALGPGGRLVYATCSLFREENEAVVSAFLRDAPRFTGDGAPLRLTPADGGDGFFACRLVHSGT